MSCYVYEYVFAYVFDRPKGRSFVFIFSLFLCVNILLSCVNISHHFAICVVWLCGCEITVFLGCQVFKFEKSAFIVTLGNKS
jgi:hypothetical protein